MEFLILFLTILYAMLSWRRLDLATAFLIMVLPVYQIRFQMGFLPMTLLEAMILVLFAVWFIKSWQAKELPLFNKKLIHVRHYPFYIEIILLLIVAFISVVIAGFSNASLGILKAYFLEPIMFFIVFVNAFKIRENREKIFWGLCISAFIISLAAIYQKVTGDLMPLKYADSGRATGLFAYPNALGLYLAPVVMVLMGWMLKIFNNQFSIFNPPASECGACRAGKFSIINFQFFKTVFIGITIILSVIVAYLAKSEGALVGIAVALFIFGMLYSNKSRLAAVAVAVVAVGVLAINGGARDYFIEKAMLRDLDGQIRRQIWKESWDMLKDGRLITGAGLANYQSAVAPYHQEGIFVKNYNDPDWLRKVRFDMEFNKKAWQPTEIYLYPHNIVLNLWSELGLMGMLLFIWIIGKFLIVSCRLSVVSKKNKGIIVGLIGAMVVILVHGLVDVPYLKNDLAILFWIMIGMAGVLNMERSPQIYPPDRLTSSRRARQINYPPAKACFTSRAGK